MEVRMKNRLLFGFFVLAFLTALVFTGCPSLTSDPDSNNPGNDLESEPEKYIPFSS
jgi:hypothetical protein